MDINLILFGALALAVLSVGGALIVATILASKALGVVRIDSSVRVAEGASTGDVNTGNGKLRADADTDMIERTHKLCRDADIELEVVEAALDGRFNGDVHEVVERARTYLGMAMLALRLARAGEWSVQMTNEELWHTWQESADGRGYFSMN